MEVKLENYKKKKEELKALQVFQTSHLRKIMKVYSTMSLMKKSSKTVNKTEVNLLWRNDDGGSWVIVLEDHTESIQKVSLGWAPEGKRRPGRPKQTWRRVVLKQMQKIGVKSWGEAGELAKDREEWRRKCDVLTKPLCVPQHSAH